VQNEHSLERNLQDVGKIHKVLIEGHSKRSKDQLQGRTSTNKVAVFPDRQYHRGQYVNVKINSCTGGTLLGEVMEVLS
jgi:tRNA-2-methylthio-N6-dimethylallyladenosine synthase